MAISQYHKRQTEKMGPLGMCINKLTNKVRDLNLNLEYVQRP